MTSFLNVMILSALFALNGESADKRQIVIEKMKAVRVGLVQNRSKAYAGDFRSVLHSRISDVNDLLTEIAAAKNVAAELAIEAGDPNEIKNAVQEAITRTAGESKLVKEAAVVDFLRAVEQLVSDPNNQPDPNDLDEQKRLAEFERAALLAGLKKLEETRP